MNSSGTCIEFLCYAAALVVGRRVIGIFGIVHAAALQFA